MRTALGKDVPLDVEDDQGNNLLHLAAEKGNTSLAKVTMRRHSQAWSMLSSVLSAANECADCLLVSAWVLHHHLCVWLRRAELAPACSFHRCSHMHSKPGAVAILMRSPVQPIPATRQPEILRLLSWHAGMPNTPPLLLHDPA